MNASTTTPEGTQGVSITISAPTNLHPEEADNLTEAERLGIVVGMAYGNAIADRDIAREMHAAAEQELTELLQAARDVLALDLVKNPTFAHDEDALARLEALCNPVPVVDSPHTAQED